MAKVHRNDRSGTPITGKGALCFYIDFIDHTGHPRSVRWGKGKKLAEEAGHMIDKFVALRSAGDYPGQDMITWFKNSPVHIHVALLRHGIVTQPKSAAYIALADHVAAWREVRPWADGSGDTADQAVLDVLAIFHEAGIRSWDEIELSKIGGALKGRAIFKRIKDRHRCADNLIRFCKWMVETERAFNVPLRDLNHVMRKIPAYTGRQILSPADFSRLVAAAGYDETITERLNGVTRAALYVVINQTGLSWGDVGRLRIGMFDLENLAIDFRSEHRNVAREEVYPLTENATAVLRRYLATRTANPMARAFYLPRCGDALEVLQHDLALAGLHYMDDEGRIFDFLALKKCPKSW